MGPVRREANPVGEAQAADVGVSYIGIRGRCASPLRPGSRGSARLP